MDDTERRSAKRSRFDQTEPEPKRTSRFDRRSRSPPPARHSDSRRSRSPVARASGSPASESARKTPLDPAAAAGELAEDHTLKALADTLGTAAAAAKINAQIQAKKGIQHVDVPPIRAVYRPLMSFWVPWERNADLLVGPESQRWKISISRSEQ